MVSCSWLPSPRPDYDLPKYKVPPRPRLEVGRKFPAKDYLKDNKNINLDNYVIEHKDELKKDITTRQKLKSHIKKLEKIIEACTDDRKR